MNRSSDSILSVYSDARAEYTKQLCVFLVPAYFQFFINLLEKSKQAMITTPKRSLWQFQTYLNEIHDWNMEKVNNEIHTIYTNCGCDYLDDLLTAVFIAYTKVLTAIRLSSNKKKIEINVPKVEHFLFKVLCETSKLLWSSTYLFREDISGIEKQQNYRNIEGILNEGILQAVRSLVPVKSILKDFVNNEGNEGNEAADDEDSDNEKEDDTKEATKEIPQEITIPEPVSVPETVPETTTAAVNTVEPPPAPVESIPKNEIVQLSEVVQLPPQTIIIEDKPTVRFGEFDAVFDSDHPMDSDMIYDPKDGDENDDVPALEILDDVGAPLSEGIDFDSLDEKKDGNEEMGVGDYEELN
uniref:Uncharacterized protein n=1 Tax=viral metagenome TaxID=1070528 RepID=A0A6C0DUF7_9ZZZZ